MPKVTIGDMVIEGDATELAQMIREIKSVPRTREYRMKLLAEIPCAICRDLFRPLRRNGVLCSKDDCRAEYNRRRSRNYARKMRRREANGLAEHQPVQTLTN